MTQKKSTAIDTTSGSISRVLLSLAVPFILAMLVETLFNITNMLFVSRLGSDAIAAVSFCGMILIGANDSIVKNGLGYTRVYFLGMTSVFFLFITQAILRGAGEPVIPVVILAISAFSNIALDFLLIFG